MSQKTFHHSSKGLEIKLEVDTNHVPASQFGSFLLGHALMVLITESDTASWSKVKGEMDEDSFLGTILAGVARNYNATRSLPQDDTTAYETLKQLIERFHENGDF